MGLTELRAEHGELRIVNQVAAVLRGCRVGSGEAPGTRAFTAQCASVNAYLMTQGPDVLVLSIGGRSVRWRVTALTYGGDQVSGTLAGSRPEVR